MCWSGARGQLRQVREPSRSPGSVTCTRWIHLAGHRPLRRLQRDALNGRFPIHPCRSKRPAGGWTELHRQRDHSDRWPSAPRRRRATPGSQRCLHRTRQRRLPNRTSEGGNASAVPFSNFDPFHPDKKLLPQIGRFFDQPSRRMLPRDLLQQLQNLGQPPQSNSAWNNLLTARKALIASEAGQTTRGAGRRHIRLCAQPLQAGWELQQLCLQIGHLWRRILHVLVG